MSEPAALLIFVSMSKAAFGRCLESPLKDLIVSRVNHFQEDEGDGLIACRYDDEERGLFICELFNYGQDHNLLESAVLPAGKALAEFQDGPGDGYILTCYGVTCFETDKATNGFRLTKGAWIDMGKYPPLEGDVIGLFSRLLDKYVLSTPDDEEDGPPPSRLLDESLLRACGIA